MDIIQAKAIITSDPQHARARHAPEYALGAAFTQGEFRPLEQGVVPVTDAGFIHADAVYDVVSASNGFIFRLEDHLRRFNQSCEKFLLDNPHSDEETIALLTELVRRTGFKDAYIWWAVTRGTLGDNRANLKFDCQFYAFVTPYVFILDDAVRTRGANLLVSSHMRIPPKAVDPTAKNFHWMDMKLAIFEAIEAGADWPILTDGNGNLAESAGANIFIVKDGVLRTPAEGCLEGITRRTVADLAKEIGIPVEYGRVTLEDLLQADEAFLTSTAGGIMPASQIDSKPIARLSSPGVLTTQLHNLYWRKRWDGWLGTPVTYA
jgi:branched-chain amino acid aminotransferase